MLLALGFCSQQRLKTQTCGSIAVGFSFSGAAMFLPKLVETVHASSQPIGSRMLI
jgi:hypothetical protein